MTSTDYKTIALHWSDTESAKHRLDVAIELADRFDAHLTVLCLGVAPDAPEMIYGGYAVDVISDSIDQVRAAAAEAEAKAQQAIERAGVRGDTRNVFTMLGGLSGTIGTMTRYADLTVVGQPQKSGEETTLTQVLEGALFDGGGGVLVCPRSGTVAFGKKALIAWNGSREALAAVRNALPLLTRTESVELLLIDPERRFYSEDDIEPGAEIAIMLSRHGCNVTDTQTASMGRSVSDIIRTRIEESGADFLVMGAYGHSRFREYLIGGTTVEILRDMPVPVLMAH